MKISSIKYLAGQGLRNIWINRVMSFASFCVIMVSLLYVGFSVLFNQNVNAIIGGIENKNEIIVFFNDETTQEQIDTMSEVLRNTDNIMSVEFYSKDEAFEHIKAEYENGEEIFSYMTENPLPNALRIKVKDISIMKKSQSFIEQYSAGNGDIVEQINAPNDFVNLLVGIKKTISLLSIIITSVVIVASLVIISNSTRSSVFARRKEVNIMKYVGATNTFIRVPFFIEGMVTGIIAGVVAGILTWFGYDSLIKVLSQEMTFWQALGIKQFILFSEVAVEIFLGYIVIGGILGSFGTVVSLRKHLKV